MKWMFYWGFLHFSLIFIRMWLIETAVRWTTIWSTFSMFHWFVRTLLSLPRYLYWLHDHPGIPSTTLHWQSLWLRTIDHFSISPLLRLSNNEIARQSAWPSYSHASSQFYCVNYREHVLAFQSREYGVNEFRVADRSLVVFWVCFHFFNFHHCIVSPHGTN